MHFALVYISRNLLSPSRLAPEVRDIVERSSVNNSSRRITGALASTPSHFAQVLEGDQSMVLELMDAILRDDRHENIFILARETLPQRTFPRWSLAHIGPSQELERAIQQAASSALAPPTSLETWKLWDLMKDLAYAQFRAPRVPPTA